MPVSFKKTTVKSAAPVAAKAAAPVVVEAEVVEIEDEIPFDLEDSNVVVVQAAEATEADVPVQAVPQAAAEMPEENAPPVSKFSHKGDAAKAKWDKAEDDTQIPYRYRMKVGETKKITFLDGDLDQTGFFENVAMTWLMMPKPGTIRM